MSIFERHVFVCQNRRPPASPKGCCAEKGAAELLDRLKQLAFEAGLKGRVRVNSAGCLGQKLPGIGRYTAGAIASIAFDLREPVLDGNVKRVLSRLLGSNAGEATLWESAAQLANGPHPGELNQALMELGALLCTPRKPDCPRCPVAGSCRAHEKGRPEEYPARRAAPAIERVRVGVALVRRAGRVLLERPGEFSPFRGSWDLPAREIDGDETGEKALSRSLVSTHGLELGVRPHAAKLFHGIMRRRLTLLVHPCRLRRGRVVQHDDLCWLDPSRLDEVAVSGATRKVLRSAGLVG